MEATRSTRKAPYLYGALYQTQKLESTLFDHQFKHIVHLAPAKIGKHRKGTVILDHDIVGYYRDVCYKTDTGGNNHDGDK